MAAGVGPGSSEQGPSIVGIFHVTEKRVSADPSEVH